jgi:hypothetical protein
MWPVHAQNVERLGRTRDFHAPAVPSLGEVFGPGGGTGPATPTVDVKSLHAKIGELTLENDFGRSAQQSRPAERKAMIDRAHDLPITCPWRIRKSSQNGSRCRKNGRFGDDQVRGLLRCGIWVSGLRTFSASSTVGARR